MSKNLPYEDQVNRQLNGDDLPIPAIEDSWQKMKHLLDEEEKRRRFPPIFFNCLLMAIGGAIVVVMMILFFSSNKDQHARSIKKRFAAGEKITVTNSRNQPRISLSTPIPAKGSIRPGKKTPVQRNQDHLQPNKDIAGSLKQEQRPFAVVQKRVEVLQQKERKTLAWRVEVKLEGSASRTRKNAVVSKKGPASKPANNTRQLAEPLANIPVDTSRVVKGSSTVVEDTVTKNKNRDTANDKPREIKSARSKALDISVGVGLQQQVPLKGQKAVPYNYYGRTGSLADYIPSAYVRMGREGKWFVQAEFRFGGPQQTRQLDYNQTQVDSFGATVTRKYVQLKKTYYHQASSSFNYFVLPNLSLGTGMMVSRFYGAVSEEETRRKNLFTQQETVLNKTIVRVPANTDSFFTRYQLHALLEAQYKWKGFSLGIRYTKGLQPFIRYISATGEQKSDKNESLQLFLRYQLWKKKVD